MLTERDIIDALIGQRPDWAGEKITGGVVNSRQTYPGALFVAIPGEHHDGHDFVGEAFDKGACLALVQRDLSSQFHQIDLHTINSRQLVDPANYPHCLYVQDSLSSLQKISAFWRRNLSVKVIGVTGSVGKTTTKELVAQVLAQRYPTLKNQGNLNNEIGLPLTLLSLDESYSRAVLEMGFYIPGEIAFLCELAQPEIGVITNIGTVHAERAGSQEVIALGKSELVRSLPPAPKGVAILNYDDPLVRNMQSVTQARVFFYGLDPKADLWADRVEGLGLDGIRFRLHYHNEVIHMRVPLIGQHSVHTVLRAAAVGLVDGLTWEEIVLGLRTGQNQLRMMTVRTKTGALVLDDTYNASPESTLAALNLLDELQGNKVAVLGDMLELGRYEHVGHEMVGVRAAQVVNLLITVGEKARIIAEAARESGFPDKSIVELNDVSNLTDYLEKNLRSGDVVLIKGSHGMRMDRVVTALEAEA